MVAVRNTAPRSQKFSRDRLKNDSYERDHYRINHGVGMNIYELDRAGRPQAGWCFVPSVDLVAGDVMLAQKIALETDELGALAVARNFTIRI